MDNFVIKTVWAVIGIGPDGDEGVAAELAVWDGKDVFMPLVASDRGRLAVIKDCAQKIANRSGRTLKLARFAVRTDVEEITPQPMEEFDV